MALEIRELKTAELDDALSFAQAGEKTCAAHEIDLRLSIAACEEGQIIGLVLCCGATSADRRFQMLLKEDRREDQALIRQLMDKALLKARASGVSRLRIEPDPAIDGPQFWTDVNWQSHVDDQTPPEDAAA